MKVERIDRALVCQHGAKTTGFLELQVLCLGLSILRGICGCGHQRLRPIHSTAGAVAHDCYQSLSRSHPAEIEGKQENDGRRVSNLSWPVAGQCC